MAQDDIPSVRQRPACLSLSPLRALPVARLDSARGSWWRDRLLDSLAVRMSGTGWRLAAAGHCPEGMPVLDVFQQPGDLSRDADGALVRLRMEWRHQNGTTIALLDDPDHPETQLGTWASQVKLSANLQLARVTVLAERPVRVYQQEDDLTWRRLGEAPLDWTQAPGPLRLRVDASGSGKRDFDTTVETGQTLKWTLNLPPAPARSRWSVPLWSASALCLAGGLWYSLEMERAYSRYARLDAHAPDAAFGSAWDRVENAQLWRNVLLTGSGTFLAGALYVHFR